MTSGFLEGMENMIGNFNFAPGEGAPAGVEGSPVAGGSEAEVVYGVQPEAEPEGQESGQPEAGAEQETAEAPKDRKAEWRKLIEGEYKEEFQNQTQGIINKRFKEMKGLQEQNAALSGLAEKLADRYGVDPRDLNALSEAIEKDQGFLREQADKAGMTVDQYREMQQMRRENAYWRQAREEQERQQRANELNQKWSQEEAAIKQMYPSFDLNTELENPEFFNLMKSGIPMEKAYQVIHYDELMTGALKYAVNEAKTQTANNIRARAMRPLEGAAQGTPAVTVKSDVNKLTKADREEIARQVMRGKTITFS